MNEALLADEHLASWLAGRPESAVRELAAAHRASWRAKLEAGHTPVATVLPLWIGRDASGDAASFVRVAAGTWAFFLGIDLLDNVNDRELDASWQRHGALAGDLATLASVALMEAAPLLAGTETAPLFAEAYWTMAEGQVLDLRSGERADPASSTEAYEDLAAKKSGAHIRLFAAVGCVAAGVGAATREALERYAGSLALAGQIASDLDDLFAQGDRSQDVLNGKATWPLARAAENLRERDAALGARFVALLERLRDPAQHAAGLPELRELVASSGALTATTFRIQLHLRRAREALAGAGLRDPGPFERFLDTISPFSGLDSLRSLDPNGGERSLDPSGGERSLDRSGPR